MKNPSQISAAASSFLSVLTPLLCVSFAACLGGCGKRENPEGVSASKATAPAKPSAESHLQTTPEPDGVYRVCALQIKGDELLGLMQAGDYAQVSDFIQKLQSAKTLTTDGVLAVGVLVECLSDAPECGPLSEAWLKQATDSPTANLLYGMWCINEAWRHRGSGWANTVTDSGWRNFDLYIGKAKKHLTQSFEIDSNNPMACAEMITVSMAQSDRESMQKWFDRATLIDPDYLESYERMLTGLLPRWCGESGEAWGFVNQYMTKSPLFGTLAYKWMDIEQSDRLKNPKSSSFITAKTILQSYMKAFPRSGSACVKYSQLLSNSGDIAEGKTYLQKAIELDPTYGTRMMYAKSLMGEGRYSEAVQQFKALAQLFPNGGKLQTSLGEACMYARDFEGGIVALNAAIRLNPKAYKAYYYLGGCLYRVGKKDDARTAFEKAVELNPKMRPAVEEFMQRQGETF